MIKVYSGHVAGVGHRGVSKSLRRFETNYYGFCHPALTNRRKEFCENVPQCTKVYHSLLLQVRTECEGGGRGRSCSRGVNQM